jgi:hypothetical protein
MFLNCGHDSTEECRCFATAAPLSQSLDELEFVRSACHAAQIGNIEKLERILASKPEAVSWDGGTGVYRLPRRLCWPCDAFCTQAKAGNSLL